jgi:phospholipase C
MPAATLGAELPVDTDIPIQNVVILMQENRSFDSLLGHLNKYAGRTDIESAPDDTTVPENTSDPSSPRHAWQHAPMLCISDTNHEWSGTHVEWDNGAMDGFWQANNGFYEAGEVTVPNSFTSAGGTTFSPLAGDRAMYWYDETDIPFYYQLASTFAIADHYFSSVLAETYPNRDYLYAATSKGVVTGNYVDTTGESFPGTDVVIFDELTKRHVSWKIYAQDLQGVPGIAPGVARLNAFFGPAKLTERLIEWGGIHIWGMAAFRLDAATGNLPQVAFVDGDVFENVNGDDDHPPSDIQTGQGFVSGVVQAVLASPQWPQSALFITYDEHGGIYDHVPPPQACPPDDIPPNLTQGADDPQYAANSSFPGSFDHLGVRVPLILVSPYAKQSYVGHEVYDHTSLTRFLEAKFKVPRSPRAMRTLCRRTICSTSRTRRS